MFLIGVFVESSARAENSRSDSVSSVSSLRTSIRYTSDYYYMGRSDSAMAPYLTPSITYYHKSGLFLHSSLSYLLASGEGRVDLYTLSGGFDYFGKNYALGIALSQYFFSESSYAIQAEMKTWIKATAGYDFRLFTIYMDGGLGFSDGTDVFLGTELTRTFYTLKNRLRLSPSFYINAGTQQYYNAYVGKRSEHTGDGMSTGHGSHTHQSATTTDIRIEESSKFQILDYELALQLSYKLNKVKFFSTGTLTFPVNPSVLTIDGIKIEEELDTGFYWSVGLRYIIF
jgi:hypothetical protein